MRFRRTPHAGKIELSTARASAAPLRIPPTAHFLASSLRISNNPHMPRPGMMWRHAMINTRCSWLHGDPRGFRSRKHQIHSSGDYKNPPPPEEHSGLHRYHKEHDGEAIILPERERELIGRKIIRYLKEEGYHVLTVAVGRVHAHALVELPQSASTVKRIFGEVKRWSSRAVVETLPGSIWGAGGKFKRVLTKSHHKNAYEYILYDQGPDAWTWSWRDSDINGIFGRKHPRPKRRKR